MTSMEILFLHTLKGLPLIFLLKQSVTVTGFTGSTIDCKTKTIWRKFCLFPHNLKRLPLLFLVKQSNCHGVLLVQPLIVKLTISWKFCLFPHCHFYFMWFCKFPHNLKGLPTYLYSLWSNCHRFYWFNHWL